MLASAQPCHWYCHPATCSADGIYRVLTKDQENRDVRQSCGSGKEGRPTAEPQPKFSKQQALSVWAGFPEECGLCWVTGSWRELPPRTEARKAGCAGGIAFSASVTPPARCLLGVPGLSLGQMLNLLLIRELHLQPNTASTFPPGTSLPPQCKTRSSKKNADTRKHSPTQKH